ncbi:MULTISPECIES: hypothetical protein [Pseudomonas]|uniref:hypothetical protein n=1 Tax=Pseudomonas TaxID=286 RepID=UPI001FED092A|nr:MULTISPECIES: hypothetical protein [Pseudomonas]
MPEAVHAQALNLLASIEQAKSARDALHAADHAEGFVLGMETLKALNAASVEALYLAFEAIAASL